MRDERTKGVYELHVPHIRDPLILLDPLESSIHGANKISIDHKKLGLYMSSDDDDYDDGLKLVITKHFMKFNFIVVLEEI